MPHRAPVWCPEKIGPAKSYEPPVAERPSASARGYGGRKWEILRRETFLRDNYICRACGNVCVEEKDGGTADQWPHCDHVVPKPQGKDEMDNLQTLCGSCHSRKTNRERRQAHVA